MKILVIGAGLIGREILKYHTEQNDTCYWLDNRSNPYLSYSNIPGQEIYQSQLHAIINSVDVVHIQASLVSVGLSTKQPEYFLNNNISIVSSVIQAVKESKNKPKIIHSSSMGLYGNPIIMPTPETAELKPINIYGCSKLAQEDALRVASQLYGIDVFSLRFFSVHGSNLSLDNPNTGILNFMKKQNQEHDSITIFGDGSQTRDIVDVSDVATACVMAAKNHEGFGFEAINIASGNSYTLNSIAQMMNVRNIKYVEERPGDIKHAHASITKADDILLWRPKKTLEEMIDEYK